MKQQNTSPEYWKGAALELEYDLYHLFCKTGF